MSKIFPENIVISEIDKKMLEDDITTHPVAAFQILNMILNERGLCLQVAGMEEFDGET